MKIFTDIPVYITSQYTNHPLGHIHYICHMFARKAVFFEIRCFCSLWFLDATDDIWKSSGDIKTIENIEKFGNNNKNVLHDEIDRQYGYESDGNFLSNSMQWLLNFFSEPQWKMFADVERWLVGRGLRTSPDAAK